MRKPAIWDPLGSLFSFSPGDGGGALTGVRGKGKKFSTKNAGGVEK
jgi:hypothetical protein